MKDILLKIKARLARLSVRTGVIFAVVCVSCYALSFLQMLLPTSVAVKGVLWACFYGMAKASQYTAILILGKTGWQRLKKKIGARQKVSG